MCISSGFLYFIKRSKNKDLSSRENEQIKVLLKKKCLKQTNIARKLNILPNSFSFIKNKEEKDAHLNSGKKLGIMAEKNNKIKDGYENNK